MFQGGETRSGVKWVILAEQSWTNKLERKDEQNGDFLGLKYSEEDSDYVARLSNSSVKKKPEA